MDTDSSATGRIGIACAGNADLEAGAGDAAVRVPDQLGAGSGRHALWAFRATVQFAIDFQKVIPAYTDCRPLDVERAHVKREWHGLLDDAVLVVGVLLAGAEVVGVHALVALGAQATYMLELYSGAAAGGLQDRS